MLSRMINVGTAVHKPGSIVRGTVKVAELCDGADLDVPVCLLCGKEPGPTLWLLNGIHGNEFVGLRAIQKIKDFHHSLDFKGTLVLVPIVNITAYRAKARSSPLDGLDMNRIWPGNSIDRAIHLFAHSELVVDRIVKEIVETGGFVISMHDGSTIATCAPYVGYFPHKEGELAEQMARAAAVTGFEFVWARSADYLRRQQPGTANQILSELGIPSLLFEAGGVGVADESVQVILNGVLNVMHELGMTSEQASQPVRQKHIQEALWLRATRGGLYIPFSPVAQATKSGEALGVITDLFGDELASIVSPNAGWVITQRGIGPVHQGEFLVEIGLALE